MSRSVLDGATPRLVQAHATDQSRRPPLDAMRAIGARTVAKLVEFKMMTVQAARPAGCADDAQAARQCHHAGACSALQSTPMGLIASRYFIEIETMGLFDDVTAAGHALGSLGGQLFKT